MDEIAEEPEKLAKDVEVINEVARYNGDKERTADELQVSAYRAIFNSL